MVAISILIPARGRPLGLRKAIGSMCARANDPEKLEFLVYIDDDDESLKDVAFIEAASEGVHVGVWSGPRKGYKRLHEYYNALASHASGDWLINWNDDVEMLTEGWDALVANTKMPPHSIQFFRRDTLEHADTTFPCTGRSVYKAMGHLSLNAHCDDWAKEIALGTGIAVMRDNIVFHHDRVDDQTSRDRDNGGYDLEGFRSAEMVAARKEDITRVLLAESKAHESDPE